MKSDDLKLPKDSTPNGFTGEVTIATRLRNCASFADEHTGTVEVSAALLSKAADALDATSQPLCEGEILPTEDGEGDRRTEIARKLYDLLKDRGWTNLLEKEHNVAWAALLVAIDYYESRTEQASGDNAAKIAAAGAELVLNAPVVHQIADDSLFTRWQHGDGYIEVTMFRADGNNVTLRLSPPALEALSDTIFVEECDQIDCGEDTCVQEPPCDRHA